MYLSKPLAAGIRLQHCFCLDMDTSPANKSQERKRKNTGSRYTAKRAQENRGSDGPQKFVSDVSSSFWQRQKVMPVLLR